MTQEERDMLIILAKVTAVEFAITGGWLYFLFG